MIIMTVKGPIAPADAGFVLSHEHLLCDLWSIVRSYDGILHDEQLASAELKRFKEAGGQTLVEVSSIGLGRNPEGLLRISSDTEVHVVMGSAWYREEGYPQYIYQLGVNELAKKIVDDVTLGVNGTGIRAGVIGEIGTERYHITPAQERVFRFVRQGTKANRRYDLDSHHPLRRIGSGADCAASRRGCFSPAHCDQPPRRPLWSAPFQENRRARSISRHRQHWLQRRWLPSR
jgi:predicted metal-dependent phosphotriesterase family hydrolase